MKRGITLLLFISILFGLTNCKKESANILYSKKYIKEIKVIRREVAVYLTSNYIPGATVAISKNSELIYSEAFGLASKDLNVPVTRNTKFRIGPLSELFTSAAYLRMVEDGVLCPDSTIQHYIPDFPEKESKITLFHLANQTSGFRIETPEETDWNIPIFTVEKGLNYFKNDPLESPPGDFQSPSIFNYNLLGAIMEKSTNLKYHYILKKYVTDTLSLTNTMVDNPFITIPGRTDFFDLNLFAQKTNARFYDLRYRAPSQGLLSNADDLVKFANALVHPGYFSEETSKTAFEPIPLYDNMPSTFKNGWTVLIDRQGRKLYAKSGSVNGGSAALLIYPEEEIIVAMTTNLTSAINNMPVFKIAKHFFPETESEEVNKKEPDNK
ncbi:MAG: serine hydrolase domain-containing protein [Bacteroidota bacterium]